MDRRIERLERDFAKYTTDVALLQSEQTHLKEVVTGWRTESAQSMSRIEGSLSVLQSLFQTSTTDPAASPLGRTLNGDIVEARAAAAAAQAIAEKVQARMLIGTGVLGVLVWLAGIFGPTIAKSLFGLAM